MHIKVKSVDQAVPDRFIKAAKTSNTQVILSSSYFLNIASSEQSSLQIFSILRSVIYHRQYKTISMAHIKKIHHGFTQERINLFRRKQQGLISEIIATGTPEGKLVFKLT